MPDIIKIEKLILLGKHGVYAKERSVEQEFEINIKIETDFGVSKNSDKIQDTVDYCVIRDNIKKIVEGTSSYLIENLSEKIAQDILTDKRV